MNRYYVLAILLCILSLLSGCATGPLVCPEGEVKYTKMMPVYECDIKGSGRGKSYTFKNGKTIPCDWREVGFCKDAYLLCKGNQCWNKPIRTGRTLHDILTEEE